jgi:glycosyltransferase involved in cell wall biosynthesis
VEPGIGALVAMSFVRITIDASHTAGSGKNTGIERVVRNLCQQLPLIASARGLDTPQVATHIRDHFFPIDGAFQRGLHRMSRWEANTTEFVPKWFQALPLAIADRWPNATLRKWFRPSPSHLGGYKIPHMLYSHVVRGTRYVRGAAVSPTSSDLLILPDAYWTAPEIWSTVAKYRQSGAFVATLVYDLIPLTHPQFVGSKRSQKFRRYLEQVIWNSDLIVAISRTVRDDVARFIDQELTPSDQPVCRDIRSFVLGAEIAYAQGGIRPEISNLFSRSDRYSPYLMVGSFDPRKNHHQAIDAFEQLWAQDPQLKLCMFGRMGSMCADVIERIQKHPMLGRGLYVFHDANDAELLHAYQHASGVLLPSIVEGFGLPIVESLWHGKKTFVSDTPIHREVGGDQCEFFALGCAKSLARAIQSWESIRDKPGAWQPATQRSAPTSWEGSAGQLLDLCLEAYTERNGGLQARAA